MERFRLNMDDLEHLLRGGELKIKNTHIILADIGNDVIMESLYQLTYDQKTRLRDVKNIGVDYNE